MPIYEYVCEACGAEREVLQKLSAPLLTQCPACGAEAFAKKVSLPSFRLKGAGWYATDFKDKPKVDAGAAKGEGASGDAKPDSGAGATEPAKETKPAPAPAEKATPAPSAPDRSSPPG